MKAAALSEYRSKIASDEDGIARRKRSYVANITSVLYLIAKAKGLNEDSV